jgi:hypothetical protein
MKKQVFGQTIPQPFKWPANAEKVTDQYVDRKGLSVALQLNGFSVVVTGPDGAAIDEIGRQLGMVFRPEWLHASTVRVSRQ